MTGFYIGFGLLIASILFLWLWPEGTAPKKEESPLAGTKNNC